MKGETSTDLTASFHKFVLQYVSFPPKAWSEFLFHTSVKKLKKKDHFITEGKKCKEMAFFTHGYFRFYYYTADASEVTLNFHFAPGFITSYTSFISQQPSRIYVQAMESITLLSIDYQPFERLMNKYPEFMKLGKMMADKIATDGEEHLFSLLNCTAEERYISLLKRRPEYIRHIPLQYIASYLGVSPETLSRIRRKVNW